MIIFKKAKDLNKYIHDLKNKENTIGFVPTMGALHEGHLSLLKEAQRKYSKVAVSIFVNPTQFNQAEDYEKYPRSNTRDIRLLEQENCDILFLPDINDIYPEEYKDSYIFDYGHLENILEGKYRPGHFKGVGQIVTRLLNIVEPDAIFIGQKDYQQCMVITKLIRDILKRNINIEIAPIIREKSGLAMSSRNIRLNAEERTDAAVIYRVLKEIKKLAGRKDPDQLIHEAKMRLMNNPSISSIDYLEIVAAENLSPIHEWSEAPNGAVALIAVHIGNVRLIDNMLLNE